MHYTIETNSITSTTHHSILSPSPIDVTGTIPTQENARENQGFLEFTLQKLQNTATEAARLLGCFEHAIRCILTVGEGAVWRIVAALVASEVCQRKAQ